MSLAAIPSRETNAASEGRRSAALLERFTPLMLLSPALAIAVVFFGLPALTMLRMSFNLHVDQRLFVPGLTFDHYGEIVSNPLFRGAVWTTIRLALIASLVTVMLGYCFAMLTWLKPRRWRLYLVGLALAPMLVSEISIIFGWWMFFPKNGLLSYALVSTGIVHEKISLMYTEFAALVGLTYLSLPFCFFILLSVFDGIDRRLLESSADLGAGPFTTFREILLPLTRGGVLAAFSQCFIWTMGTYATPTALGPDALWTMGLLVQEQMLSKHNWPLASAFAMLLVAIIAMVMFVARSLSPRRIDYHD
jgi:ABC-type spermidine/putrescine transport system permease subunit I